MPIDQLIEVIVGGILRLIEAGGYPGIFLLMTLESACMPVPSEIVMPFAGYLTLRGDMHIHLVAWAGTLGCQTGSVISYLLGRRYGGRAVDLLVNYRLIGRGYVEEAFSWLRRHGSKAVFTARLLPAVRTVISLPAGIAGIGFPEFFLYSILGSAIWCYILSYSGLILGENWRLISRILDKILIVLVVVLILYVAYRLRLRGRPPSG